ncbi:MAG: hypothetical protein QOI82_1847, partial [Actinomycetota bacterium]|nr:hypothetical protein [Actinomycetota bacterium]
MTRPPFGFGPGDRPDEPDDGSGDDPMGLAKMFGGLFGGGGAGGDLLGQLSSLMSWSGGPVNWDLATSIAGNANPAESEDVVGPEDRTAVADACRLADLWLDPLTTLPGSGGTGQAWTRREWLETTKPAWRQLVDPVAGRVVTAMGGAMERGLAGGFGGALGEGLPEEMQGMLGGLGPLKGVMDQVGGFVFGAQV